jgi:hypothetical protein
LCPSWGYTYFLIEPVPEETKDQETTLMAMAGPSSLWKGDSGSSCHICNDKESFIKLSFNGPFKYISTGIGCVQPTGVGTVNVLVKTTEDKQNVMRLGEVYFVPFFPLNIFSLQRFYQKGGRIRDFALIGPDKKVVGSFTSSFDLRVVEEPSFHRGSYQLPPLAC